MTVQLYVWRVVRSHLRIRGGRFAPCNQAATAGPPCLKAFKYKGVGKRESSCGGDDVWRKLGAFPFTAVQTPAVLTECGSLGKTGGGG